MTSDGRLTTEARGWKLAQVYSRLDEATYRYESAGGQFAADLKVAPAGFVTNYPGVWQAEAST